MDIHEFKRNYYLFNPADYGRIFVFVDFSNVRHWAKSFWIDENKKYFKKEIDIKKIADIANWINPVKKFFITAITKNTRNYQLNIILMKNTDNLFIV